MPLAGFVFYIFPSNFESQKMSMADDDLNSLVFVVVWYFLWLGGVSLLGGESSGSNGEGYYDLIIRLSH